MRRKSQLTKNKRNQVQQKKQTIHQFTYLDVDLDQLRERSCGEIRTVAAREGHRLYLGWGWGRKQQIVLMGLLTTKQEVWPTETPERVKPHLRVTVTLLEVASKEWSSARARASIR